MFAFSILYTATLMKLILANFVGEHSANLSHCVAVQQYVRKYDYLKSRGNFLYIEAYDAVGNFFSDLRLLLKVAIILDVAIMVNVQHVYEWLVMLEPNLIELFVYNEPTFILFRNECVAFKLSSYRTKGYLSMNSNELEKFWSHKSFKNNAFNHLSFLESQTNEMQLKFPAYCSFNMALKWTRFALRKEIEMFGRIKSEGFNTDNYVVWQARTSEGEVTGFRPSIHGHVITHSDSMNYSAVCDVFMMNQKYMDKIFFNKNSTLPSILIVGNGITMKNSCLSRFQTSHRVFSLDFNYSGSLHTQYKQLVVYVIVMLELKAIFKSQGLIYTGSSFVSFVLNVLHRRVDKVEIPKSNYERVRLFSVVLSES